MVSLVHSDSSSEAWGNSLELAVACHEIVSATTSHQGILETQLVIGAEAPGGLRLVPAKTGGYATTRDLELCGCRRLAESASTLNSSMHFVINIFSLLIMHY